MESKQHLLPAVRHTSHKPTQRESKIRQAKASRKSGEDFEVRNPKWQHWREYDAKRDHHLEQYFNRKYQHRQAKVKQRRCITIATQISHTSVEGRKGASPESSQSPSYHLNLRKKEQQQRVALLISKMVNSNPYTTMSVSQRQLLKQIRKSTAEPNNNATPPLRPCGPFQRRYNITVTQPSSKLLPHVEPSHQQLQQYIQAMRSRLTLSPMKSNQTQH